MKSDNVCETVRRRRSQHLTVLLLLGVLAVHGASLAGAQGAPRGISPWWPKVDEVEERLRSQDWQKAQKSARKLADKILSSAWNDRELGAVLAELALYQAIAEVNLDRRDDALWHWQMALNLSPRMKRRDLSSYGKAGAVLSELPLRHQGEKPPGFDVRDAPLTNIYQPAEKRSLAKSPLLSNDMAAREGSPELVFEVVIDEKGYVHHPVVVTDYLNPNVIYAALEHYHGKQVFEPARINGEPVAILMFLEVDFASSRW